MLMVAWSEGQSSLGMFAYDKTDWFMIAAGPKQVSQ